MVAVYQQCLHVLTVNGSYRYTLPRIALFKKLTLQNINSDLYNEDSSVYHVVIIHY